MGAGVSCIAILHRNWPLASLRGFSPAGPTPAFKFNYKTIFFVDKKHTMCYICSMSFYNWNKEKNEWLKKNRKIGFEDIIFLIRVCP